MKMKIDSKMAPIILFAALSLIFIIFMAVNINGIVADRAELAEKESILATSTMRRDYLMNLSANKDLIEKKADDFSAMLPAGLLQNDIFSEVHKLSGGYGVSVSQISFDNSAKVEEGVTANKIEFSLVMEGVFQDCMKLLEDFCGGDRVRQIKLLTLSDAGKEPGVVAVNATIAVYYR